MYWWDRQLNFCGKINRTSGRWVVSELLKNNYLCHVGEVCPDGRLDDGPITSYLTALRSGVQRTVILWSEVLHRLEWFTGVGRSVCVLWPCWMHCCGLWVQRVWFMGVVVPVVSGHSASSIELCTDGAKEAATKCGWCQGCIGGGCHVGNLPGWPSPNSAYDRSTRAVSAPRSGSRGRETSWSESPGRCQGWRATGVWSEGATISG